MTKMAREYHDTMQLVDVPDDDYGRMMCTEEVLTKCDVHLSQHEYNELNKDLTEDDIRNALKLSSNGRASGVNGIRYEFFKMMDIEYKKSKDKPGGAFNILGYLADLYCDIEQFGIVEGCDFNMGWLCPVFKKGDTTLISNYRPITLLNTDYKLMMKAYSIRLMNIAPSLIKPDQAGFMKGRKIEDQVKLIHWKLCGVFYTSGALHRLQSSMSIKQYCFPLGVSHIVRRL